MTKTTMRRAGTVVLVALGIALVACGGLSDEDACRRVLSLCSINTGPRPIPVECDPAELAKRSNSDDVKDCIEDAQTCDRAATCLEMGKPKEPAGDEAKD